DFEFSREKRKGQSAIEYLTTYGWALLAIVIVGALLMQTGVFSQCQRVNGFSTQTSSVKLSTFEYANSTRVAFRVRNMKQNTVTVDRVWFSTDGGSTWTSYNMGATLANSERSAPQTANVGTMSGCQTLEVAIQYTDQNLGQSFNSTAQLTDSVSG
ncbi:MAG: hypothetical protein SVU32_01325, partial [Candidatus Nanohaloarchaea archaeon]|nr:hypothetical protein [Candidatus Nanohaloarchaea archaeon]